MPPKTSFEKLASAWDEMTGEGDRGQSSITDTVFFKLLGGTKRKKIYEVACGNGYLLRKLQQKGAGELWGSDVSPSLIEKAQAKSDGISYSVREGTNIKDLPREYFDAIIIHSSIFYIKDLKRFFKNMKLLLKPGGMLLFDVTHPLYTIANMDIKKSYQDAHETIHYYRPYLQEYLKKINKTWNVKGTKVPAQYWSYKRPISVYVNTCIEEGFAIRAFIEPKTAAKIKGKFRYSTIPSIYVIKVTSI